MQKSTPPASSNENAGISINKFISSSGYCSRREADEMLKQGRVEINSDLAQITDRVMPGDKVFVDGFAINAQKKFTYIAFNKPVGLTCTTDEKDRTNIISFIKHAKRIFPIGRLDKDSMGLILLTDDGDIVNHILRQENNHDKEYIVRVNRALDKDFAKQMAAPMMIDGQKTKPCKVRIISKHEFKIILTQGLNRQIRKMCMQLGYRVTDLMRIRIMNIHLGTIKSGKWRNLTEAEVKSLR
jgi:23S rRNA pseudouridine2604 synthase